MCEILVNLTEEEAKELKDYILNNKYSPQKAVELIKKI